MLICLDLEPFFLELSDGRWELDACLSLIGDLDDALSCQLFKGVVMPPDTRSAAVIAPSFLCQAAFNLYQLRVYGISFASCLYLTYVFGDSSHVWREIGPTTAWLA